MSNINNSEMRRSHFTKLLISFLVIIFTVIIDQLTKMLAVKYLEPIYDYPLWRGVLHLTYVENTGAAFGMLKDSRWVFMLASSVAVILMTALLILYRNKLNTFVSVSFALVIGGGIGNMIDRIVYGYVVDFINFEFIDFAVFNAADSFVCVGVALIFVYIIFLEDGGLFHLKTAKGSLVTDETENEAVPAVSDEKTDAGTVAKKNEIDIKVSPKSDSMRRAAGPAATRRASSALRNIRESVSSVKADAAADAGRSDNLKSEKTEFDDVLDSETGSE